MTRTAWAIRIILLVAMGAICLITWRVSMPARRLSRTAGYLGAFSVGMTRGDVIKLLGQPAKEFHEREELVKAFPEWPISEREVDADGSVLCFVGPTGAPAAGDLGLFYVDRQGIVTTFVLMGSTEAGAGASP